jgi:hypothetical protein
MFEAFSFQGFPIVLICVAVILGIVVFVFAIR